MPGETGGGVRARKVDGQERKKVLPLLFIRDHDCSALYGRGRLDPCGALPSRNRQGNRLCRPVRSPAGMVFPFSLSTDKIFSRKMDVRRNRSAALSGFRRDPSGALFRRRKGDITATQETPGGRRLRLPCRNCGTDGCCVTLKRHRAPITYDYTTFKNTYQLTTCESLKRVLTCNRDFDMVIIRYT